MRKFKYFNQMFEVETGTIVTTDIEPAISIDHNERLVEGITSLQAVLGITELTPMASGSVIKQYKYEKGEDPAQVAEGELIGLTHFTRKLANTYDVVLKKFRKQSTAEAIQRVGRTKAVDDTDTKMERSIQKGIKSDFFTFLKAGTGSATAKAITKEENALQSALAAIWGQLTVHFQDIDATPIFFVNPLDIADYLSVASITTQSSFGFKYIEDFIGLGTVIIDPSIVKGKPQGTVKENLNGVYIPTGGDVGTAFGLTSDTTGLVGMKHYLSDDHASVDTLFMTGVTFYAEDASGVFTCALPTVTKAASV